MVGLIEAPRTKIRSTPPLTGKLHIRVGFDLDGVLCDINIVELEFIRNTKFLSTPSRSEEEVGDFVERWYYRTRRPLLDARDFLRDGDEPVIITARSNKWLAETMAWRDRYYPGWPIYLTQKADGELFKVKGPSDMAVNEVAVTIARSKAELIKTLGISVYIDDGPDIVAALRELLPDVTTLQYGGRGVNA